MLLPLCGWKMISNISDESSNYRHVSNQVGSESFVIHEMPMPLVKYGAARLMQDVLVDVAKQVGVVSKSSIGLMIYLRRRLVMLSYVNHPTEERHITPDGTNEALRKFYHGCPTTVKFNLD